MAPHSEHTRTQQITKHVVSERRARQNNTQKDNEALAWERNALFLFGRRVESNWHVYGQWGPPCKLANGPCRMARWQTVQECPPAIVLIVVRDGGALQRSLLLSSRAKPLGVNRVLCHVISQGCLFAFSPAAAPKRPVVYIRHRTEPHNCAPYFPTSAALHCLFYTIPLVVEWPPAPHPTQFLVLGEPAES